MTFLAESDSQFDPTEILELAGWPKWPPKKGAVPEYEEWWKKGVYNLPTKPHLPNAVFVVIDGSPQAGKSTVKDGIQKQIDESGLAQDWDVIIYDELTISNPHEVVVSRPSLPPPIGSRVEDNDRLLSIDRKTDWDTSFILQMEKLLWWQALTVNLVMNPRERKTLVIGYRGPVDIMIWQYATAAHQGDPSFEVPDEARILLPEWGSYMALAQTMFSKIDAIAQIGISQQEAQRRRKMAGKTESGWVTDSPMYRDLHCWTNYWIDKVYPIVRDIHGTGLAVIDGDDALENLTEKLSSYIIEVLQKV